jgi:predicted O-linked N-acetylglucosamine transferase (SPINDLY family)
MTVDEAMAQALAAARARDWGTAEALLAAVLNVRGDHPGALQLYGRVLVESGRPAPAIGILKRAATLDSGSPETLFLLGNALAALGRHADAVRSYGAVLARNPRHAEACFNRGNSFMALRAFDEAIGSFRRASELRPGFADAHLNLGNALSESGAFEDALRSYDAAIAILPSPAAYNNRGNALRSLRRLNEAMASFERALALHPDLAEAINNRANVLVDAGRPLDALRDFDRALLLQPAAGTWMSRGNLLRDQKRYAEALDSYARAVALDGSLPYAFGAWLHLKMRMCDWNDLPQALERLARGLANRERICPPFSVLVALDSPALQRAAAEIWVADRLSPPSALPPIPARGPRERVRIGYFSADFHEHATMHLLAELFERHDRRCFEITAFSFGHDAADPLRQRVAAAFDRFLDVRNQSDRDIALLARALEIDIAVDLKGYTQGNRAGILALRAAPLQVNYMGYAGTTGAPFIDYFVGDRVVIPEDCAQYFSERIVRMPETYWVVDTRRAIAESTLDRAAAGLPETGFVFCCFNSCYKITPAMFDCWMRILRAVDGSVLWLLRENEWAEANLRREAAARGIDPERVVFAPFLPSAEHLARHRLADLFIDTLPCNAHTTASDALWTGLPVVTCPGSSLVSRVATSILHAARLPELVAASLDEYEARAIELARDRAALQALREKLAAHRATAPLFDVETWTRDLEAAYRTMYDRYAQGLPPESFDVAR